MLFEVLADYQLPMYGYASRTKGNRIPWPADGLSSTPMTCPIVTISGKKKTVKLPTRAQNFLKSINSASAYKYIIVKGQGWFNQPFPKAETLAMGSGPRYEQKNYVEGVQVSDKFIKIKTFSLNQTSFPNPSTARKDYPYLIHRFNIIGNRDQVYDGKQGGVYIFLISDVEMYIPVTRVMRV